MWEKPYISIFVEIGALRNFTHFGGHLKNGCQNDRHFEIALVTIKGDYYNNRIKESEMCK
jgi:predicted DNA-binding protein with PD1-like motif